MFLRGYIACSCCSRAVVPQPSGCAAMADASSGGGSSIAGSGESDGSVVAAGHVKRRRRSRLGEAAVGPARLAALLASADGRWGRACSKEPARSALQAAAPPYGELPDGVALVGLVVFRSWRVSPPEHEHLELLRRSLRSQAGQCLGYLDYPVLARACCSRPARVVAATVVEVARACQCEDLEFERSEGDGAGRLTYAALIHEWSAEFGIKATLPPIPVCLCVSLALAVAFGSFRSLGLTAVTPKTRRSHLLAPGLISKAALRRIRKQLQASPQTAAQASETAEAADAWQRAAVAALKPQGPRKPRAAGPCCKRGALDPLCVFRFLKSSAYLKDLRHVKACNEATLTAMLPEDSQDLIQRAQLPPSRALLLKARVRLEAVSLLLLRAKWAHICQQGRFVRHTLGCDASPQMGLELLASSFDSVADGDASTLEHRSLPLVALGTNRVRLQDKVMSLLWQVWLAVGPTSSGALEWAATPRPTPK